MKFTPVKYSKPIFIVLIIVYDLKKMKHIVLVNTNVSVV